MTDTNTWEIQMAQSDRQILIKKLIRALNLVSGVCVISSFGIMLPHFVGQPGRQFYASFGTVLPLLGIALFAWMTTQLLGYFTPKQTASSKKILAGAIVAFTVVGLFLFGANGFVQYLAHPPAYLPNPTGSPSPTDVAPMPFQSNYTLPPYGVDSLLIKGVKQGERVSINISSLYEESFDSEIGVASGLKLYPSYGLISNNEFTHLHNFIAESNGDLLIKITHYNYQNMFSQWFPNINYFIVKSSHIVEEATPYSYSGKIVGNETVLLRLTRVERSELLIVSTPRIDMQFLYVLLDPSNQTISSKEILALGLAQVAEFEGDYYLELSRCRAANSIFSKTTEDIEFRVESSHQIR
jgi:hypothetical protein